MPANYLQRQINALARPFFLFALISRSHNFQYRLAFDIHKAHSTRAKSSSSFCICPHLCFLSPSDCCTRLDQVLWARLTVGFTFGGGIRPARIQLVWQFWVSHWERPPTWVSVQMLLSWNSHIFKPRASWFHLGPTNYGGTFVWEMFGHSSSPSLFPPSKHSSNTFRNSTLPRGVGGQPTPLPVYVIWDCCLMPAASSPWKCDYLSRAHLCPAFYIMGFETKHVPTSICECISDNYASVIYLGTFF